MTRNSKDKFPKQRKPIIVLVCEGRNQTETLYFRHFNKRTNPFNMKIYSSEATDPASIAKKARRICEDLQLDNSLGDRIFCLVDLDLSQSQYEKILLEKQKNNNKKCKIDFVVSNPCFEVWLLYYFTQYPKVENSSQKVKAQLKNEYVPQYTESYDIIKECNLENSYATAINHADLRQMNYDKEHDSILDLNPYTEVLDLVAFLTTPIDNVQNFDE